MDSREISLLANISLIALPLSCQMTDGSRKIILDAIIKKHFGLWSDLQTEENILKIKERIWDEFNEAKAPLDVQDLSFSLYEFSEFLNRQSKYVLGNQRSYEVFGWDWHLPLWDKEYIDFWQKVPLKLKYKQKLYEDMLVEQNWGGVWNTLLPAPSWHTPSAIVPIRHLAHLFCVPFVNKFGNLLISAFLVI